MSSHKKSIDIWNSEGEVREFESVYRTSRFNAWVNIMYGCNNFCTYCIVPYVRGRERSRKIEDIVSEVSSLVKSGKYRTITLLGQNVNSYGKDFGDSKINFVYLLSNLCEIEGDFKLKFMTSHPKDFSEELVDFISKTDKVSHAIHLPAQSGSDEVLRRMNRTYTSSQYKNLVTQIYKKIPDATLTTDIIVGFPGESEEDFEKTLDLIKFCNYTGVFGFVYSRRKGTPADSFPDQIDAKTKKSRITRLFALQREIIKKQLEDMVGKKVLCMIDEKKENYFIAKTDSGKSIRLEGQFEIGDMVQAKVTSLKGGELFGKLMGGNND